MSPERSKLSIIGALLLNGAAASLCSPPVFATPRFARSPFEVPPSALLVFSGTSPESQGLCELKIKTDAQGRFTHVKVTGLFFGRAIMPPVGMQQTDHGYEGIVDFFKGISPANVSYESHVFHAGLTLSWASQGLPLHTKEAQFFGENIKNINYFSYKEQSSFLNLRGQCHDLTLVESHLGDGKK